MTNRFFLYRAVRNAHEIWGVTLFLSKSVAYKRYVHVCYEKDSGPEAPLGLFSMV